MRLNLEVIWRRAFQKSALRSFFMGIAEGGGRWRRWGQRWSGRAECLRSPNAGVLHCRLAIVSKLCGGLIWKGWLGHDYFALVEPRETVEVRAGNGWVKIYGREVSSLPLRPISLRTYEFTLQFFGDVFGLSQKILGPLPPFWDWGHHDCHYDIKQNRGQERWVLAM